MQGGQFGHGFVSADVIKAVMPGVVSIDAHPFVQGTIVSIVCGAVSQVTGGKFANGAVTSAMAFAFNQVASSDRERQAAQAQGEEITGPYHSAFDPADDNYHDYDRLTVICVLSTEGCSMPMMSPIVGSNSVPLTLFYNGPGPYALPYGLNLDPIVHRQPEPGVWWNITEPGHRYHPGVVVHALYESGNKLWLYTRGVGTGPNAAQNVAAGEVLFKNMHINVQRQAHQQLHGGPPPWVP